MEQKQLTLLEHLSSPPVFNGVHVTRSLILYVCFVDRCLSFCTFVDLLIEWYFAPTEAMFQLYRHMKHYTDNKMKKENKHTVKFQIWYSYLYKSTIC